MTGACQSINKIANILAKKGGYQAILFYVQHSILLDPPNFPGWKQYPVRAELEKRLDTHELINDDARTSAL